MLIQMLQTYVAKPDRLAELADAVTDYEQLLATIGFIGRRRRSIYSHPTKQQVIQLATLQHPDAVADIRNCRLPEVVQGFAEIKSLIVAEPLIEVFPTLNTRDEKYCLHTRWKEIVMICDPVQGHSGLRCNECGGIIARYKLGLHKLTPRRMWEWEVLYERLYDLWQISTEYREWAEIQLSSVESPITQLGMNLCRHINEETGIRSLYYVHLKEEGLDRRCPRCNQNMHEAVGTIWNLSCRDCAVAVGRG